jgi:hypothetical protein
MKYCNILLSALATVMTLTGIMPCGACAADAVRAASLGHNKAITHRVYEEGLNRSRVGGAIQSGLRRPRQYVDVYPRRRAGSGGCALDRAWDQHRHGSWLSSDGSGRAGHRHHSLPDGRWAHCRGMDVRHSHGLMKQLGMLPTPATGSATGGSPADGTAR